MGFEHHVLVGVGGPWVGLLCQAKHLLWDFCLVTRTSIRNTKWASHPNELQELPRAGFNRVLACISQS